MSAEVIDTEPSVSVQHADDGDGGVSAISHSISQKGKHSYYYAHGSNIGLKERPLAYDEPPRLLAVEEKPVADTKPLKKRPIDGYAWSDGKDNVKIYITFAGAPELSEEAISISHTEKSVDLSITKGDEVHILKLSPLSNTIKAATVRQRADKVIVTLTKEDSISWYSLLKGSSSAHDYDYDE